MIWNDVMSAGTTLSTAPVPSTYGTYSGKYGANVMTSSPGSVTHLMACARAPAAPDVMKMSSGTYSMPKRRFSESATAFLTEYIVSVGL